MRRHSRGIFRSIRDVGSFYKRKFLWTLTPTPIDLSFNGTSGNQTLRCDFSLADLAGTTDMVPVSNPAATSSMGIYQLNDINDLSDLFLQARVSKCRVFWEVTGDRTNARFNLGTIPQVGVQTPTSSANDGDACLSFKRDLQQQPYFQNPQRAFAGTPYNQAYTVPEHVASVLQQKTVRRHSVWKGSRTFIPSQLRVDNVVQQAYDGTAVGFNTAANFYPIYKRWSLTSPPNASNIGQAYPNFPQVLYNGISLSYPQIVMQNTFSNVTGAEGIVATAPGAATVTGNYFLTVWMETEIEWRRPVSSANTIEYGPAPGRAAEPNPFTTPTQPRKRPNVIVPDSVSEPLRKQVKQEILGGLGPIGGLLHHVMKRDLKEDE